MKKIISSLLLLAMLGGTACSAGTPAQSAGTEKPAEMSAQPAGGGKVLDGRWLNPDIIGNVTEETPAELKDNFALYVNKDWILSVQRQ